jgi:regulatory protein
VPPSKPDPADEAACRRVAIELMARREHSRAELTRKLAAREFHGDVIAAALDALAESGLLAETRFIESFIRSRVTKGQGPVRIRAELAQRGVAEPQAAESLGDAAVDWVAMARAVRRKRFGAALPKEFKERARQARFLQYRGFDSRAVQLALEADGDEADAC